MERMMEMGSGRSWTALEWHFAGEDILVVITGGEAPHIGATALAWQEDGACQVRLASIPGHRESELACSCAEAICRVVGRTTLVSCGIHIDSARRQEIEVLCEHVRLLTERLTARLLEEDGRV